MTFDAVKASQLLDGACGLEFHMQLSHEQARAKKALAGNADALIGTAILCIIAGRTTKAIELLNRAYVWLVEAIATDEKPCRYFPFGTEALNNANAALAHWLIYGSEATKHLDKAAEMLDKYLASKPGTSLKTMSLYLPIYLDSGHYQRAIDLLTSQREWAVPSPGKGRWSVAEATYMLAMSHLHDDFSVESIRARIDSFLDRSLPNWMSDGQYADAARWIKIVRWKRVAVAMEPMALINTNFAGD